MSQFRIKKKRGKYIKVPIRKTTPYRERLLKISPPRNFGRNWEPDLLDANQFTDTDFTVWFILSQFYGHVRLGHGGEILYVTMGCKRALQGKIFQCIFKVLGDIEALSKLSDWNFEVHVSSWKPLGKFEVAFSLQSLSNSNVHQTAISLWQSLHGEQRQCTIKEFIRAFMATAALNRTISGKKE